MFRRTALSPTDGTTEGLVEDDDAAETPTEEKAKKRRSVRKTFSSKKSSKHENEPSSTSTPEPDSSTAPVKKRNLMAKWRLTAKKSSKAYKGIAAKDVTKNKKVYGIPLTEAVKELSIPLPYVVLDSILYIEEHGLKTEGLYRLSGQKSKIERIKKLYDEGNPVKLDEILRADSPDDINAVTGALKLYFRELPENLLCGLTSELEAAIGAIDVHTKIQTVRHLMGSLPTPHITLLGWLCKHLKMVAMYSEDNKMTERNLLIIFSPTTRIPLVLLRFFLDHSDDIFPEIQSMQLSSLLPNWDDEDDNGSYDDAFDSDGLRSPVDGATPDLLSSSGRSVADEKKADAPRTVVSPNPTDPEEAKSPRLDKVASCELIVPAEQTDRIRGNLRLLEQELASYHKEISEYSKKGEEVPQKVMDDTWDLQRRVTDLKRELKRSFVEGDMVTSLQKFTLNQASIEEQDEEKEEAGDANKDTSSEETENNFAYQKYLDPQDSSTHINLEEAVLVDVLETVKDELTLQHEELVAVNTKVALALKEEKALRNTIRLELQRLKDSDSDEAASISGKIQTDVSAAELQTQLKNMGEAQEALKLQGVEVAQKLAEERNKCMSLRVSIETILKKDPTIDISQFDWPRDWAYRCPEGYQDVEENADTVES